jgi:hypothetical protein
LRRCSFSTADEIWENMPADGARPASVHIALLPAESGHGDD